MNLSRWLINRKLLWLNLFHYAFRPAKEQILRTKTTESFVQESLTHFLTYNTALRRQTDKHTAKCLLLYSTLRIILIIIITNLLWNYGKRLHSKATEDETASRKVLPDTLFNVFINKLFIFESPIISKISRTLFSFPTI